MVKKEKKDYDCYQKLIFIFQQVRTTYVDCIVHYSMLRDWSEPGLVVRIGPDGTEPERALGKTTSYVN